MFSLKRSPFPFELRFWLAQFSWTSTQLPQQHWALSAEQCPILLWLVGTVREWHRLPECGRPNRNVLRQQLLKTELVFSVLACHQTYLGLTLNSQNLPPAWIPVAQKNPALFYAQQYSNGHAVAPGIGYVRMEYGE